MKGIFYFFNAVMIASMALFSACSKSGSNEAAPKTNGPVISSISVNQGSFQTQVVINGSGFGANINDNLVYFNGELAIVDFAGTQQLTVEVPLGAGTGNITISVNNGPVVVGPKFTYVPSAIVSTFVGGDPLYPFVDGQGTVASLGYTPGLTIDHAGNFYTTDLNNHAIRKITPSGYVSTIFRQAIALYFGDNCDFHALAVDNLGNVYATDTYHHTIVRITPSGDTSTFAGNGHAINADGALLQASFAYPNGIVIDNNNTMYITDQTTNTIRKISNGFVSTLAGGNPGASDGMGTAASFHNPTGIVIGNDGNLYIADTGNNLIRRVTPQGAVTTIAGSGSSASINGIGTKASFFSPFSITEDKNGNFYVGEYGPTNTYIRKIAPDGTVTTFAGNGDTGAFNGPGSQATFNYPASMVFDQSGGLFIADFYNGLVRKILTE